MKFVLRDESGYIGHYDLLLVDDNGKELERIWIRDYTNEFQKNNDIELRVYRDYAFEVGYCKGFSMCEGFGENKNCRDEYGFRGNRYGFQGSTDYTLDKVIEWCKNYLAQMYLRGYYNTLKRLDEMKRRVEWFEQQGFEVEEGVQK